MASNAQQLPQQAATEREHSLLDRIAEQQAIDATRYKPVMSVDESIERYKSIEKFVRECMQDGVDFGKPPGFPKESKPFLYKAGAQKLCAFFGYVPAYEEMEAIEEWTDSKYGEPLFYYKLRCTLAKNREPVGEGIGSCNTWETKYRYRNSSRMCPECNAEAIIKGKAEYGGGFLCFAKKGGCGAKFAEDDEAILGQETGKVPNPDISDMINTVQKQAEKRAYVEAVLSATGASAFFSQDEDVVKPPPQKTEPKPAENGKPARAAKPIDPFLESELKRSMESPEKAEEVIQGLITSLDELIGSTACDAAWSKAVKRHGDPKKKPSATDPVIRELWSALEAAKFAGEANPA